MAPVTTYRLLGSVEVERDGRLVELGGPKQRAVLAVLLLDAGRVVSTDRLVDAVWGDDQPPSVTASLQAQISNLRRLLRDGTRATSPIVRRTPGYLIEVADGDLDVAQFRAACERAQSAVDSADWARAVSAAEQALDLWRGPLLAEYADEEWVRVPAALLEDLRASAGQNLTVGLLGTGRVGAGVARAQQLAADQPLSERAAWLQMLALHRSGRSADALDAYREHARLVDRELGLEPGPALRELQGAILRQEPQLDSWPLAAGDAAVGVGNALSAAAAPPVTEVTPDLVGRAHELGVLDALLEQARAGSTRWLVLSGAAGIGKSRLAEEAVARWRAAGGRALAAGCPDDEGVPSWWPVRRLLRELGADPDHVLTPPPGVDADNARYTTYERVLAVLADAVHEQPLLLLIEDVHWADPTTLRFLTHLSESPAWPGLVVVLTARETPSRPDVLRLLASAARRRGARQLAVPPLQAAEVAQLATRVSGQQLDPEEAAELAARTGGNPFFVSEYARLPAEERRAGDVPVAVRSVLSRRLAAVDPAVLQVLRAAAAIGDQLDIELLGAVTRLHGDELADLLDDAADEHLIVTSPNNGGYAFAHALLREEVLAGMSDVRLRRMHLRIAESIDSGRGSDQLVSRAAHLLAALPLADAREAFEAARSAALDAEQRWESEAAAQWWGNALTTFDQLGSAPDVDRDELVIAQVAALARAGRGQTVLDVIDAGIVDAVRRDRMESAGRLAATLLRITGAWPWAVYGQDHVPLFTRLSGLEPALRQHPSAHARVLAALAVGSYYDPEGRAPDELSRRALDIAESSGDDETLADALLGRAMAFSGIAVRAAESIELVQRLQGLPHRASRHDEVIGHGLLYLARMARGEPGAAEDVRLGALGADVLRLPASRVQFRWAEGSLALWRGDHLDRAEELYERARLMHAKTELYRAGVDDIARMCLRWEQGRLTEAADLEDADPRILPWARAVIAVARGDADADLLLEGELARPEAMTWTTHCRLTMLAHAVADLGAQRHVAGLTRRLEPVADCVANIGTVGVVGPVALGLARIRSLVGDLDAARAHLRTAVEVCERSGGNGSLLRCRLVEAELAERAGEPVDVAALREVAEQAHRRGMVRVATDAEALANRGEQDSA